MSSNHMNIEGVLAQMRAVAIRAQSQPTAAPPAAEPPLNFSDLLKQSVDAVNTTQQRASGLAQDFEIGKRETDLAEVMVSMQKSSLSFQAMVQVRNKCMDAYKEVMSMPI